MLKKTLPIFILLIGLNYATLAQKSISLFNGKDLTGWHIDVPEMDKDKTAKNPFIVRDDNLISLGKPGGHLITDSVYSNYQLTVIYRFANTPGNCGVLVHASTPRALYSMFPKSLEVQMQHQDAGDFWCIEEDITVPDMESRRGPKENWGTSAGKLRRIKKISESAEKPLGQWNKMIIQCVKNEVKVWVNNKLMNYGTNCTANKGQIALQAEGAEVEFKTLNIKPIKKLSK